jgi:hypothetical protein
MRTKVLAIVVSLSLVSAAAAQSDDPLERPPGLLLLVQSELDALSAASKRISVEFEEASPAQVLKEVGKKARILLEVRGDLPEEPKLSAIFSDETVKEILTWYARETSVVYRAESPDKLIVVVRPEEAGPGHTSSPAG